MAMVELGADHVTLGVPTLEDLTSGSGLSKHSKGQWKVSMKEQMKQPHFQWEDWKVKGKDVSTSRMEEVSKFDPNSKMANEDWRTASTKINYLAPGVLDKYNEEDVVTKERLALALKRFGVWEEESKKYIEAIQAENK
jgi:transaldolase